MCTRTYCPLMIDGEIHENPFCDIPFTRKNFLQDTQGDCHQDIVCLPRQIFPKGAVREFNALR